MKTENDHINLKVAGQDGSVVQFKIKRHTPLNKLMKAYCERQVKHFHAHSAASFTIPYKNNNVNPSVKCTGCAVLATKRQE